MTAPDASSSPFIRSRLDKPLETRNGVHWQRVRFYEQQIVALELAQSRRIQASQPGSMVDQVQDGFDQGSHAAKLARLYVLRDLALSRLY